MLLIMFKQNSVLFLCWIKLSSYFPVQQNELSVGIICNGTTLSSQLPLPQHHPFFFPLTSSTMSKWCVPWLCQALKTQTRLIYRDEKGSWDVSRWTTAMLWFQCCPHSTVIVFYSCSTNLSLHLPLISTCSGAEARDGIKPTKFGCPRQPQTVSGAITHSIREKYFTVFTLKYYRH